MVSKILSKTINNKGLTLIELVLTFTFFAAMLVTVILYVNPPESRKRARDNKRLSDLSVLDRALVEYRLDNGAYPDVNDVTRVSTLLPGGGIALDNSSSGWILADLSSYTQRLPIDPINDATYYYSYRRSDGSYELNAVLEYLTSEMSNDGGNDNNKYEIGNNLTLLSP